MTPERWQRAKQIFHSALGRAPGERSAFLADACSGDESLRQEVESLISSHEKEGSFIDSPAYEASAVLVVNEKTELKPGQVFGSYEIISFISRGGMGEVYLAHDKRLGRKVALKLLPSSVTKDANRLHRFEQEARAASALNHPNIITIYEIHEANSTLMIATEFVEGETLRQRMSKETIDLHQALHIAIQIADALAAAHKAGIIHRDIKPENIMIRPDGYVKVLDFGLAKLIEAQSPMAAAEAPTRKVQTGSGVIMGTIGYMSPEQARGKTVDARSDIFNLGALIYEMAGGRKPFEGETPSDVLAAILKSEPPPLSHSAPEAPPELVRILTKALRKDREQRYQVIVDMLLDLKSLKEELEFQVKLDRSVIPSKSNEFSAAVSQSQRLTTEKSSASTDEIRIAVSTITHSLSTEIKRHKAGAILAVTALVVVTTAGVFGLYRFLNRNRSAPQASEQPQVLKTTQLTFSTALDQFPSLSPDGNSIAYCSDQNGSFEIYVKQLTPGGREIQLTTDGQQNLEPAWSRDGQRIAFYSRGRGGIWVMPAFGGSAKQLTEFGSCPAWSRDSSMIAFQSGTPADIAASVSMPPSTIWVIPSQGGTARQITKQGTPQGGHGDPSWSPDGKRIVFDAKDYLLSSAWSVSVGGGELKKIATNGIRPIYTPDGQYVYVSWWGGSILGLSRIPLSPMGEPTGEPVEVGPRNFMPGLTISADGKRIAYSHIRISSNLWSVSLSPGSGETSGLPTPFTRDTSLRNNLARFSPDGRKLALTRWRLGTSGDIWVADADGKNLTQLTTNPTDDNQPNWFPDSQRIAFLSDRNNNHLTLWSISLATGKEEPLLDLGEGVEFVVLSPNGKQVAFNSKKSGTINVWIAPIGGGEAKQLTFDNELMGFPSWSPDGQFLAFETKRGDDAHVFIIPSNGGTPVQLTFDHGQSWPHSWSPDGDKIAFAGLRNGIWNIYWVSRSTKEQKQLTHYSKLNAFARYPAWNPLGNQIVYEYAETIGNIWLMELK